MCIPEKLKDILQGNPTIQPVATAGTSILSKSSKRKTDESIGPLPDFQLNKNTESESDQLQPPKQVNVRETVALLKYLMYLISTLKNNKKGQRRGNKGKNANA